MYLSIPWQHISMSLYYCITQMYYNLVNLSPFRLFFLLLFLFNAGNSAISILGYKAFGLLFPQNKFLEDDLIDQWVCTLLQSLVLFNSHVQTPIQQQHDSIYCVISQTQDLNSRLWRDKHLLRRLAIFSFCYLSPVCLRQFPFHFSNFFLLLSDFWSYLLPILVSRLNRKTTKLSPRHAPQCQRDNCLKCL